MTTEEVEVTTESIETEKVTFCDSCGATEDVVSLVKCEKADEIEPATLFAIGGGPSECPSSSPSHTDSNTIDACEPCLREHFNEDVVTPAIIDRRDETPKSDTTAGTGDDSERLPEIANRFSRCVELALTWPWLVVPAPFDFAAVLFYWIGLAFAIATIATA